MHVLHKKSGFFLFWRTQTIQMDGSQIFTYLLIILNLAISYKGFTNQAFMEGYQFEVDRILVNKDYIRLISSGFLHTGWPHLILNMVSLYIFSQSVELYLGSMNFLIVYFASLLGGNLFSLFMHRNHADYSSVGASGAISGVIFASIALFPGMRMGMFFLPFYMPAWLYGLLYVGASIYGIRSNKNNIGHDAHLGGAVIGMLVALAIRPDAIVENYATILIIIIPVSVFIYFTIRRPGALLIDNLYFKTHNYYSIDHRYNAEKAARQQEVDRLLDKIARKGMASLSKKETELLKRHSEKVN